MIKTFEQVIVQSVQVMKVLSDSSHQKDRAIEKLTDRIAQKEEQMVKFKENQKIERMKYQKKIETF